MRGRTLNDAVVNPGRAQKPPLQQIKNVPRTRKGMEYQMIITGDMTQIDLPASQTSGLVQALHSKRSERNQFCQNWIKRH